MRKSRYTEEQRIGPIRDAKQLCEGDDEGENARLKRPPAGAVLDHAAPKVAFGVRR